MAALTSRREPTEAEIQKAILHYLALQKGIVFWRQNSGSFIAPVIRSLSVILDKFGLGKKKLAIMSAIKRAAGNYKCASESGLPDIIVVYRSIFVGLEVKTKTGRLTKDQKVMHKRMNDNNVKIFVVRNIDDVKEAFLNVDKMFSRNA